MSPAATRSRVSSCLRERVILVRSPERDAIAAELRAMPAAADQSIDAKRAAIDSTAAHGLDALGVERTPAVLAANVTVEWLTVAEPTSDAVVVFLHGGGYVVCGIASHRDRAGRIALAAGCDGLVVEYRLAPEHPYPAAIDDTVAVCRAVQASGRPLVLVGDSAGGGLVMATLLRLRDAGDPLPLAGVCISPWVDLTLTAPSLRNRRAQDPFAHLDDLPACVEAYLGERDRRDPGASPLFGDLAGLPPLLIQVGSDETMHDDAVALAHRAADAGVAVELEVWTAMFHTWHAYSGRLDAADAALAAIGDFIRRSAPDDFGRSRPPEVSP